MYKNENNRSIDDICSDIWNKAMRLAYKNADAAKPTNHYFSHSVLDFMPPSINKWMEGRMSIKDSMRWTPERVVLRLLAIEYLLDKDIKSQH